MKGDCNLIMEQLQQEGTKVDLTVTSPPYDNLRTYDNSLEWNEGIWKAVIDNLYKITKDGGVVVWIVNDATIKGNETGTSFKQALYFKEVGFNLHDTMIWLKDGGGAVGSQLCYVQNFEYMFVFSKGRPNTIDRIRDVPNGSYGKDKSGVGRRKQNGSHKIEKRKPCSEFKVRNNYWYCPPQKGGEHPAVFPLTLVEDHIRSWSKTGDIIFDPFMGSGTTGVASLNNDRKFIGIEKVSTYFDLAVESIRSAREMNEI